MLKAPVSLGNVAPELISLDRSNLGNSILVGRINLETEKQQASRILKEFPSKNNPGAANLVLSPPGTGDRVRSEPLIKEITKTTSMNTPSTKKPKNQMGTIDEESDV